MRELLQHHRGRGGRGRAYAGLALMGDPRFGEKMSGMSEIADGMKIDRDVPITMDDGLVLRADVYRPIEDGEYPVILTYGPYAKNMPFQVLYADQWRGNCPYHPSLINSSPSQDSSWGGG